MGQDYILDAELIGGAAIIALGVYTIWSLFNTKGDLANAAKGAVDTVSAPFQWAYQQGQNVAIKSQVQNVANTNGINGYNNAVVIDSNTPLTIQQMQQQSGGSATQQGNPIIVVSNGNITQAYGGNIDLTTANKDAISNGLNAQTGAVAGSMGNPYNVSGTPIVQSSTINQGWNGPGYYIGFPVNTYMQTGGIVTVYVGDQNYFNKLSNSSYNPNGIGWFGL